MNLVKLSKYFIFISFLIIATSCETTDVEEKVIKPEPVPKIIYTPEVEEPVKENDEIVEHFKGGVSTDPKQAACQTDGRIAHV